MSASWSTTPGFCSRPCRPPRSSAPSCCSPIPGPSCATRSGGIINRTSLGALARILRPGGELRLATDDLDYARWMLEAALGQADLVWQAERAADWRCRPAGWPPTRYEEKAREAGSTPGLLALSPSRLSEAGAPPALRSCATTILAPYCPHFRSPLNRVEGGLSARSFRAISRPRTRPFDALAQLIEPTLRDMGFDLVLVRLAGTSRRTLQVMAEPLDPARRMSVEDCVALSHALSAVLDVADPDRRCVRSGGRVARNRSPPRSAPRLRAPSRGLRPGSRPVCRSRAARSGRVCSAAHSTTSS